MTTNRSRGIHKPFEALKKMLERKARQMETTTPETARSPEPTPTLSEEVEARLFDEAMAGVIRISRGNCVERETVIQQTGDTQRSEGDDTMLALEQLIRSGAGFVVSQTAEYVESSGEGSHPELTQRLHRGDFTIQDHLDLHGLGVQEARASLERFLKQSIEAGKHGVLIVHGRGLSSPRKPILKSMVCKWLSSGYWRKWVIAFSSARLCDGGAGATYVLLRHRPLTRRGRKGFKKAR
jgi:DNA-nicking Smr family endonuclease